jgi:succinate dehydrogenase / fumarate reductase cytochrome b subunit
MSTKPVFINLLKIRLPIAAFMSITHRISGVALFFIVLPFSGYLLNLFLSSESSYNLTIENFKTDFLFRTFVLFCVFIFQFHIFSGLRHILHDFHFLPDTIKSATWSAKITLGLFFINALLIIWVLL